MARAKNNLWNRYKYKINGVVILLAGYFLYTTLFPQFPDTWAAKKVGQFEVTPMPYNLDAPYFHDGVYTKDFFLMFNEGDVNSIKQAYLTIGEKALPLETLAAEDHGILHGSEHGQEVHGLAPKELTSNHRVWLTIQTWQGEILLTSWPLPQSLLSNSY
ncbi:hypothetical protein [Thalassotalea sediminis]|uniref:hypothetical protein n=1 Tax=Thalassotalea sediminis TaxID=1759089 RepID=UPI0025747402|nr:hypothetical protein [Thalassotalea sediminis]